MLKYNIEFGNNVIEFYNRDNKQWIKIGTPKLSKDHIESTSQKIKVKYAVQVFGNCVAAGMCTQTSSNFLPNVS